MQAIITFIEGVLAGIALMILPDYVPMLLAVLAFIAYAALRGGRSLIMYCWFYLSAWAGMLAALVLRNHSVKLVNWAQASECGIDLGLIMIAIVLILYLGPVFKGKLGRLGMIWSVPLAIAVGVLLGLANNSFKSQVDFSIILVLMGGLLVMLLGETFSRHLAHVLTFGIAYILTLFLSMSGLSFLKYSAYEFMLLFLPYYGVLLVAACIPLLSSYANRDAALQIKFGEITWFEKKRCPNCGAVVSKDTVFCSACGNAVDQNVS